MFQFYLTQYNGAFLGPIAKVLGKIFSFIYAILAKVGIENAAVTIIIFTFLINMLMLPITIKQQKFSKMQSKMQPEMAAIQAKYKGKKDQESMAAQQEELQALYRKYGTSPAGGCLPMIITMIVFFALYKVIYAIPAYVPEIHQIYDNVAVLTDQNEDALQYVLDAGKDLRVTGVSWSDMTLEKLHENRDYVVDCLTKFGGENWTKLSSYFADDDLSTINKSVKRIKKVNTLFGLNLAETPMAKPFPGLIIPFLCMIFQFLQTHLMMNKNMTSRPDDPTQASMKMMNKTMPIVSGLISLGFPIGNGVYLASSSLFRIIQQYFINKSMDDMDIDAEIEKNLEKERKVREKMKLEASDGSVKNIAKMKVTSKDDDNNKDEGKKYEKGSISAIAHMMNSKEN